ncbi:efflux RND transporter periplasmic adaptor subunit [Pseudoroseomonas wenyumeiae]|uniref:Efflux RND transporter periplasmic adaptor subunit n=3 Tax=Teichococcus wenyumeiae TaxID=2478470 RepID=A0ABX9VM97_9PROT|nr:efflux RND transporter periplasmic adaptor subunit [Pseudoroseomonas wenyumeiae]RMI25036.1 efflux RND transporter periplasmic adaptor subunit [Pseudoroseomonas wenyumeiae]
MSRFFRFLVMLLVLAAVLAGGWWWWQQRSAAQEAGNSAPAAVPGSRRGGRGPGGGPGAPGAVAIPVTMTTAEQRDLPLTLDALGTVSALASVVVRPQVEGQLMELLFREGQEVKAGDILARIDDRTYRAALAQAEAKKAYDAAQLANAKVDLARYQQLLSASGVTRQQVDTQRAQVAMFEAQIQQDQAAIDSAKTQLDYTVIRSPIDGRVGLRQVDPGNIVRSSDAEGLVTVTQLRPIAATFSLPQQELPRLLRAMAAGPVPVESIPAQASDPVERGTVLTVDNAVDAATGTVRVKATFPNDSGRLWPGAFVNLRIRMEVIQDAVVVPLVAVQQGPRGAYAFVVKPDNTVEMRDIVLGAVTQSEAAVRQGLAPGEQVVTSGALRLNAGSRVTPAEPQTAAPRAAPAAGAVEPGQRRRDPPQPGAAPAQPPATAPGATTGNAS